MRYYKIYIHPSNRRSLKLHSTIFLSDSPTTRDSRLPSMLHEDTRVTSQLSGDTETADAVVLCGAIMSTMDFQW